MSSPNQSTKNSTFFEKTYQDKFKEHREKVLTGHSDMLDSMSYDIQRQKHIARQQKQHEKEFNDAWNSVNLDQWKMNQKRAKARKDLKKKVEQDAINRRDNQRNLALQNLRSHTLSNIDEFDQKLEIYLVTKRDDVKDESDTKLFKTLTGASSFGAAGNGISAANALLNIDLTCLDTIVMEEELNATQIKIKEERTETINRQTNRDVKRRKFVRENNFLLESQTMSYFKLDLTNQIMNECIGEVYENEVNSHVIHYKDIIRENRYNRDVIINELNESFKTQNNSWQKELVNREVFWEINDNCNSQMFRHQLINESISSATHQQNIEFINIIVDQLIDLSEWVISCRVLGLYDYKVEENIISNIPQAKVEVIEDNSKRRKSVGGVQEAKITEEPKNISQDVLNEQSRHETMDAIPHDLWNDIKHIFLLNHNIPKSVPLPVPLDQYLIELPYSKSKKPNCHSPDWLFKEIFSSKQLLKHQNNKYNSISYFPLVIAGPSGVGKGTLVNKLIDKYPSLFGFSVSHTTRQPRPGEENGVHYHFAQQEEINKKISRGEFLEYAQVHTNTYGTSFEAVQQVQNKGMVCVLDIDIQGVKNVKNSSITSKYVFISPPSLESLESRLRGRNTETEEKIQIRLKNAKDELEYGHTPGQFDSIIINDEIDRAFEELVDLLQQWYPQLFESNAFKNDDVNLLSELLNKYDTNEYNNKINGDSIIAATFNPTNDHHHSLAMVPAWMRNKEEKYLLGEAIIHLRIVDNPLPAVPDMLIDTSHIPLRSAVYGLSYLQRREFTKILSSHIVGLHIIILDDLIKNAIQNYQNYSLANCNFDSMELTMDDPADMSYNDNIYNNDHNDNNGYNLLCQQIFNHLSEGATLTDELSVALIVHTIKNIPLRNNGYILQDFPNTKQQALLLMKSFSNIDYNITPPQPSDRSSLYAPIQQVSSDNIIKHDSKRCGFDVIIYLDNTLSPLSDTSENQYENGSNQNQKLILSHIKSIIQQRQVAENGKLINISSGMDSLDGLEGVNETCYPIPTTGLKLTLDSKATDDMVALFSSMGIIEKLPFHFENNLDNNLDNDNNRRDYDDNVLSDMNAKAEEICNRFIPVDHLSIEYLSADDLLIKPIETLTMMNTFKMDINNKIDNNTDNNNTENNNNENEIVNEKVYPHIPTPIILSHILNKLWTSVEQQSTNDSNNFFGSLRNSKYLFLQRTRAIHDMIHSSIHQLGNRQESYNDFIHYFNNIDNNMRFDIDTISELHLSYILFDMTKATIFMENKIMNELENVIIINNNNDEKITNKNNKNNKNEKGKDKKGNDGNNNFIPYRSPIAEMKLSSNNMMMIPEPPGITQENNDPKSKTNKKDPKGKAGGNGSEEVVDLFQEMVIMAMEDVNKWSKESFQVNRDLYGNDEEVCIALESSIWFEANKVKSRIEYLNEIVTSHIRWIQETESNSIHVMNNIIHSRFEKEVSCLNRLLELLQLSIENAQPVHEQWLVTNDVIVITKNKLLCELPPDNPIPGIHEYPGHEFNEEQKIILKNWCDLLSIKMNSNDGIQLRLLNEDILSLLDRCFTSCGPYGIQSSYLFDIHNNNQIIENNDNILSNSMRISHVQHMTLPLLWRKIHNNDINNDNNSKDLSDNLNEMLLALDEQNYQKILMKWMNNINFKNDNKISQPFGKENMYSQK
eukprot:gene8935-12050_t